MGVSIALIMRILLFIFIIISLLIWLIAGTVEKRVESISPVGASSHCRTPTPIPTPVPIYSLYSEWIPYPGYSANMGAGWIRARDFVNVRDELVGVNKVPHLTDEEWQVIAEEHGAHYTIAGEWVYGFQPVMGFSTMWSGSVIKDEWLPDRLR